jgi:hypothetical protein
MAELKQEGKTVAKAVCTIEVRGNTVEFDHPPTSDDIESLGFKHIGGKFHVYNKDNQMVKKSEFPFTGEKLYLREYHAPATLLQKAVAYFIPTKTDLIWG